MKKLTFDEMCKMTSRMRESGYAVCVFTPDELSGVRPKYVEEAMSEHGNAVIETLKEGE